MGNRVKIHKHFYDENASIKAKKLENHIDTDIN